MTLCPPLFLCNATAKVAMAAVMSFPAVSSPASPCALLLLKLTPHYHPHCAAVSPVAATLTSSPSHLIIQPLPPAPVLSLAPPDRALLSHHTIYKLLDHGAVP